MGHDDKATARPAGDVDLAALFQQAPVGFAVLDPDLRYLQCNEALATMNGIPAARHLGRTVREMVPELADQVEPRFREAFRTGQPVETRVSGLTPKAPRRIRRYLEEVTPFKDSDGQVRHILVTVREITDLETAQADLQASQRALGAWQRVSPDGLSMMCAVRDDGGQVVDFVWEYANPSAMRIMAAPQLVGRRLSEVLTDSLTHPELFPRYVRQLSTPGVSEVELSYNYDGRTVWFRDAAVALDTDRVAVGFRDISRHKLKEEQIRLVSRELRHRVKNVVAIVSALIAQQARYSADIGEFSAAVLQRLDALSGAQDLLAADGERDVPLEAIAHAALDPFGSPRIVVQPGPPVAIRARSVTLLTMALNELATNAVKHGVLSVEQGVAVLSWTVSQHQVGLEWRESGGLEVSPPLREGFGSRLLAEAARRLPGGALHRAFPPQGAQVTIAFAAAAGRAG